MGDEGVMGRREWMGGGGRELRECNGRKEDRRGTERERNLATTVISKSRRLCSTKNKLFSYLL